jgi:signal peptidase I
MKELVKKIKKIKEKIENNPILIVLTKIIKTILYIFLSCVLVLIIVQKVTKNNFAIGGVRIFTIVSGSMVPEYQIGDVLISESVKPEELKIGDNVTYYGEKGDMANLVVTHKIINIRQENGKLYFITKGTANPVADPEITQDQIYGRVAYKTVFFSWLGKIMSNIVAYYVLFIIIALLTSYQIVKSIFEKDEEDESIGEEK